MLVCYDEKHHGLKNNNMVIVKEPVTFHKQINKILKHCLDL